MNQEPTNIISTLSQLAPSIDDAVKKELLREGLSKKGDLVNSVITGLVKVDDSYQLQTYMLDYWQFLDVVYDFMTQAIQPMVGNITDAVTHAANADITHIINQIFQQ